VIAGLLGVGGGLIIVPVLTWLFTLQGFAAEHIVQLAVGSSLATIVFTSLSSAWAHARRGAVRWPLAGQLAVGIIMGAWLGGFLAIGLGGVRLALVFGVFEISVAAYMLLGRPPAPHRTAPGPLRNAAAGGFIGGLSALLGIGGGTMTVPWLVWHNVGMRHAVATSAACGLPIAAVGALGFVLAGWDLDLPAGSTGFLFWPAVVAVSLASITGAPIGAGLAHRVDQLKLKRIFALFLMFLGSLMIAKSLLGGSIFA
jgi:uncharacterized membrane protein YfcA